jgi:hypothetical protein
MAFIPFANAADPWYRSGMGRVLIVTNAILGTILSGVAAYYTAMGYYAAHPNGPVRGAPVSSSAPTLLLVGLLILGLILLASSWAMAWWINNPTRLRAGAEIRLRSYGDTRMPEKLSDENVWRWFVLRTLQMNISNPKRPKTQEIHCTLYLSFDKPIRAGTLTISSPDAKLPRHEVKEFNNRYAIVTFEGSLPVGTLVAVAH